MPDKGHRYLLGTCTLNGGRTRTATECVSSNIYKRGILGAGWLVVGIHHVSEAGIPQSKGFRFDSVELEYSTADMPPTKPEQ
jgi:hypothetical protein